LPLNEGADALLSVLSSPSIFTLFSVWRKSFINQGTVVKSTATNGSFKEGDEVFGLTTGGAYSEFAVVPARMVMHKPKELTFEEAAGIPENFLTAWQALSFVTKLQKVREGISGGYSLEEKRFRL